MSKFNVGFQHPIQDNVIIFISGEMPHLIKKIVNALERSGSVKSIDLYFRGQHVSVKMLQQVWLCDQTENKIGSIRTNFRQMITGHQEHPSIG